MNLDQAIKKIISDNGADILKERRFVSLLSDYQAFGQLPYAANMLRQIYANGYGTKIHKLYLNKDKTETAAFQSELRNKLGFDVEMLSKVFYAFSLPITPKKNNGIKPSNTVHHSIDMQIEKRGRKTVFKDEFNGIYSYPNADTFIRLESSIYKYDIKDSTKYISDGAFSHKWDLESVTLPNSVVQIGHRAFDNCYKLKSIEIGTSSSLISIGNFAFRHCSFEHITIPNSVKKIGDFAFSECSLKRIIIPDSVKYIGDCAFYECIALEEIEISSPDTLFSSCICGVYGLKGCTFMLPHNSCMKDRLSYTKIEYY